MVQTSIMDGEAGSYDFADDTSNQLHHAVHQYLLELGWTTKVHGSELVLELDNDIWGLQIPNDIATQLLTELAGRRLSCPVVDIPGRWKVVLVEPADGVGSTPSLPESVSRIPSGAWVPLPPTVTPRGPVRWMSGHEPHGVPRPSARMIADVLGRLVRW